MNEFRLSSNKLANTAIAKSVHSIIYCAVMALSACGGGGGGSAAPGTGTTAPPTTTPTTPTTPDTPSTPGTSTYGSILKADLGVGASLHGAIPFPSDNAWNLNISSAPVDPASDAIIASIGLNTGLHPDFGSGLYAGAPIGIPYTVVDSTQAKVAVNFQAYGDESDAGPYPIPANAPIEGQPSNGAAFSGDRHVLVLDRSANRLYELYNAIPNADGSWKADSGAVFHLDSNNVRPTAKAGWTSADAAGLPIFPGLARYDEVAAGVIAHALRFTVQRSRNAYVPPATHAASSSTDASLPPMGMRVRLKAGYAIPASFSNDTKVILQALKTYGMIVADNGSNWYISGAPDARWNNDKLVSELGSVRGSNFEVVRMDGLVTPQAASSGPDPGSTWKMFQHERGQEQRRRQYAYGNERQGATTTPRSC